MREFARDPSYTVLLDQSSSLSDDQQTRLLADLWSPKNFFKVWEYIKDYVEYTGSSDLGKYYMER